MTACFLSDEDIRKLDRDLRILIATNGTLSRVLEVVANDEIVVQIVEQQIHDTAPKISGLEQLAISRVLQRRILLKGQSTGNPFVAAESWIAVDLLPPGIMTRLMTTDCPIGEAIATSCLETFKEPPQVWIGELPDWLSPAEYRNSQLGTVGRRYRIFSGGRPILIVTEYFLRSVFPGCAAQRPAQR
jgi:chorismate-pyruvate lyase